MLRKMENEAMAAILHGQESVKTLKMLTNGSDPTVAAHLDNILHSFTLLSFLIHSPNSESSAKQSLNKKSSGERKEEDCVFHTVDSPTPILDDGFLWRNYGQKTIKGSPYQRSYYKCVNAKNPNCNAKKQVQEIQDNPSLFRTTYIGQHTCQAAINLYPTKDNTNNSTKMIQFERQDQTMTDLKYDENPQNQEHQNYKLHDSISVGTDNPVVDDDFDFLLNLEKFWSNELS